MADPAVPSREAPLDRAVAAVLVYYQTEAAVADPRESLEEGLRRTLVASGLPAEVERLRTALSNLVSYAENIPAIGDPDAWHGWQDFKANIKQARSAVAAEQGGETDG